jgi:3-isopropylmalate dehydrogenase
LTKRIAVIAGDGIGIDVTVEALKALDAVRSTDGLDIEWVEMPYGADHYLETGITMPEEQVEEFREDYDAIFLGAVGDPRIPDMIHGREILLGLRFKLDLFINFRPIKLLDPALCPLKGRGVDDICFEVFRENTEGLYVGIGGIFKKGTPDEIALQESVNTRKGVERIIRAAFEHAEAQGHDRVCMSNKSNALRFGHDLWDRTFEEVGAEHPGIAKHHWYVDALVMQMVKRPEQFQTIVTSNMFGDIITDLGAQFQGGLGLAASANIHPGKVSLFEPVHGSAPKYHNKNVANPMAAILSAAMLLSHVGLPESAARVERAVAESYHQGICTKDLGGDRGTTEVGDRVAGLIRDRV